MRAGRMHKPFSFSLIAIVPCFARDARRISRDAVVSDRCGGGEGSTATDRL